MFATAAAGRPLLWRCLAASVRLWLVVRGLDDLARSMPVFLVLVFGLARFEPEVIRAFAYGLFGVFGLLFDGRFLRVAGAGATQV